MRVKVVVRACRDLLKTDNPLLHPEIPLTLAAYLFHAQTSTFTFALFTYGIPELAHILVSGK